MRERNVHPEAFRFIGNVQKGGYQYFDYDEISFCLLGVSNRPLNATDMKDFVNL